MVRSAENSSRDNMKSFTVLRQCTVTVTKLYKMCVLIEPQNHQTLCWRFKPGNEFRNTSVISLSCTSNSTLFLAMLAASVGPDLYFNNKLFFNTLFHCQIHVFRKWRHGDWGYQANADLPFQLNFPFLSKILFIYAFLRVFGQRTFKSKDVQCKCHLYCPPLSLHTSEATSDWCLSCQLSIQHNLNTISPTNLFCLSQPSL